MKSGIVLTSLLWVFLVGCSRISNPVGPDVSELDATVNGKTVAYSQGENFVLRLDSWADAGYRWDCDISDTLVVNTYGEPIYKQKQEGPIVPGGLSVAAFTFIAKKAGQTRLRLTERQPWMSDVAPHDSVIFFVSVKR